MHMYTHIHTHKQQIGYIFLDVLECTVKETDKHHDQEQGVLIFLLYVLFIYMPDKGSESFFPIIISCRLKAS